jgi:hypothetical protein
MNREKCGTYAGYNAHKYYGERPCDECNEAGNAYQRQRRKANPEIAARENAMTNARARALWRLKDIHTDEFELLYADEMRRLEAS